MMHNSSPSRAALNVFLAPVQRNPAAKRRSMSSSKTTTNSKKKADHNNHHQQVSDSVTLSPTSIANQYEMHNRKRNKNYDRSLLEQRHKNADEENLIVEDVVESSNSNKKQQNNTSTTATTKKVRFNKSDDDDDFEKDSADGDETSNNKNRTADGGDIADSSSLSRHQQQPQQQKKNTTTTTASRSNNHNNSGALVKYSAGAITSSSANSNNNNNNHSSASSNMMMMAVVYDPDPEIDSLVKRKLGQDNSNRIRLNRTLSALEQDLSLARKEHATLSSRAKAIPQFQEQLPTLREECVNLRDDLENLEIEFGFLQQRYKDIDSKLDPLESSTSKNKKKLAAAVKESRSQQMNATVVSLQKKEKMLTEEIERLTAQRERAIANEKEAMQRKEKEEGVSAAMREQALRKALDEVRSQHQAKRNAAIHQLQTSFSEEIRQMAEDEVIRETREANKVGESTKKLGRAELENTAKKHEVTELTQRHAQQTARLQELTADLAVEQQRLAQSETALGPAQEELETLNKLIHSAQLHLEQQALESQVKKDQKQSASNAASQAWQIEVTDLEKTIVALETKVAGLREREAALSQQVEKRRKQKEELEKSNKNEIANLMSQSQKLIDDGKTQSDQMTEEIQKYNAAAEKLEQEAAQIQQRLGASQKTEIIMQLQRQNGDLQGQIDSLNKGNNKLDERLKKILGQLGDDVML